MSSGVSSWFHRRRSSSNDDHATESQKVHYSEEDEMELEEDDEEEEDLSEVSPSGDVERMIGSGGCPAVYKGSRRVSVDASHQGIY